MEIYIPIKSSNLSLTKFILLEIYRLVHFSRSIHLMLQSTKSTKVKREYFHNKLRPIYTFVDWNLRPVE